MYAYQGNSRTVTFHNASSPGGSTLSMSPEGNQCAVTGKDSLRILRVSDGSQRPISEYKYAIGAGGYRVDASRNFWTGSGLKADSALTDVVWCHKFFSNKILTSARNGDLILWDINKPGSLKYERKIRGHMRSINKLSYSNSLPHLCCTGSSDGNLRIWDLRDLSKASHYVSHQFAVRTVLFSPAATDPFAAITALDNGTICRWDLRMGQKGQLERIPLAHTGAVMSLDWLDTQSHIGGWLASAGLDRVVKIWEITESHTSVPRRPSYTLHTSYPVRRAIWRPGHETELAIASNNESTYSIGSRTTPQSSTSLHTNVSGLGERKRASQIHTNGDEQSSVLRVDELLSTSTKDETPETGDSIEIWDVRRQWIAKWTVNGSSIEGGVSDMVFMDPHALWVQHPSGAFSQMDINLSEKPIDSFPQSSLAWAPSGSLTFVNGISTNRDIPFDDNIPYMIEQKANKGQPVKKLGDPPFMPTSQSVGTLVDLDNSIDWDAFRFLAQKYKIEGEERISLCNSNAEAAFDVGEDDAGSIWLLLGSLLTDLKRPQLAPLSRKPSIPGVPHPETVPIGASTVNRSLAKAPQTRSPSSDRAPPSVPGTRRIEEKKSGIFTPSGSSRTPQVLASASPSLSKSAASHDSCEHLPSVDDLYNHRRKSVNVASVMRSGRNSFKKHSLSVASQSQREDVSSSSRPRRSHNDNERARNDSDTSDGESASNEYISAIERQHEEMKSRKSVESFHSSITSASSTVAKHPKIDPEMKEDHWAEDEKESSSSDSTSASEIGSKESAASTTATRSEPLSRSSRSHSPSITPSSASLFLQKSQNLVRTDSQSSALTVTAGGGYIVNDRLMSQGEPLQSQNAAETKSLASSDKSRKRRSQTLSATDVQPQHDGQDIVSLDSQEEIHFLEWNHIAIREAEIAYRQAGWDTLKVILEELVETGDIQMCAMLACVARKELGISAIKANQFVEAYLDLLFRLRLHVALAYMRKYAPLAPIRKQTRIQTTLYSLCSTCKKPIIEPVPEIPKEKRQHWRGYSQCIKCKKALVTCAICRLPVRTGLFFCAICTHGGHRNCYYQYYTQRPMDEIKVSTLPVSEDRGRRSVRSPGVLPREPDGSYFSRVDEDVVEENKDNIVIRLMGHPCAAGCGHYCWAASERMTSM